jgi:hypothetical protein
VTFFGSIPESSDSVIRMNGMVARMRKRNASEASLWRGSQVTHSTSGGAMGTHSAHRQQQVHVSGEKTDT